MLHIRNFMAAFSLALTALIVGAPAYAQGTTIIVVDPGRVMEESRAGQDMRGKLETIQGQMQGELEPTANSLEQLGSSIEARTANMTPEAIRADESLRSQAIDYQTRLQGLAQESDRRSTQMALTERCSMSNYNRALRPVIDQIRQERGADIVIGAGNVMIATPTVDVTDLVIQRFNATTPSISVTRQTVPAPNTQFTCQ